MAEELSQDSSRPQETLQDSGVSSEGQFSNLTGENNAAQSNPKSQASTTQNNQNNKKYDLGVLFVHGIGNQQAGQTFDAMYDSIKDELISDGSISFIQSSKNKSEASGTVSLEGESKKILFRESHWNLDSDDENKASDDENNKFVLKYFVLGALQIICWAFYVLGVRISKSFNLPLLVFGLSAIFAVFNKSLEVQKLDRPFYIIVYALLLILSVVICGVIKKLKTILFVLGLDIYIALLIFVPWDALPPIFSPGNTLFRIVFSWGILPSGITYRVALIVAPVLLFLVYILNVKYWDIVYFIFNKNEIVSETLNNVEKLWFQINKSADYIRTGEVFQYIEIVEGKINDILDESDQVIIIGHSMGECLSYNALKRNILSYKDGRVHLIGVGGGLGLVSLVGRLRMSTRSHELSKIWSTVVTFGGAVLGGGMLWITCYLWHLFYLSFSRLLQNLLDINSWLDLFGLSLRVCMLYAFIYFVAQIVGIGSLGLKNFKFYKYSHWMDPVGNSANFFYGNKADMYTTPKFLPGHGISTYFAKGVNFIKSKNQILNHEEINDLYLRRMVVWHIKSSIFKVAPLIKSANYSLIIFMCSNLALWVAIAVYEGIVGVPAEKILVGILIYASIINIILYPSLIMLIWYGEIVSFVRSKPADPLMLNVLYAVFLAFAFGVEGSYIIDIFYSIVY